MKFLESDKTILVVEDELIVALDLKLTLNKLGYKVLATVATGEKAISYSSTLMPKLVLMDINLKGHINGIDAARIILNLNIPIIFLTAQNDEPTLNHINALRCPYIIKPYNTFRLNSVIEEALVKHHTAQLR